MIKTVEETAAEILQMNPTTIKDSEKTVKNSFRKIRGAVKFNFTTPLIYSKIVKELPKGNK